MADVRETTTGLLLNRSAKGDVKTQVEKLTIQPIYSTFSQTHKVGNNGISIYFPTAREGNVVTRVCDSVHNQPQGYSVTAHPCWLLGHSLLWRGRYASYWNAFLLRFYSLFRYKMLVNVN